MTRAILLTGFNNWGKTRHIYSLFNQGRFYKGKPYAIAGVNTMFTVESHSNDDYDEADFIDTIKEKMKLAPANGKDLFCAFCPSRETTNESRRILQTNPFTKFDDIHLLLLRYKWDFHAELRIADIKKYGSSLNSVGSNTGRREIEGRS